MRKIILLLSLFLLIPSMASARFGTGIGITFPASSSGSSAPQSTSASLTYEHPLLAPTKDEPDLRHHHHRQEREKALAVVGQHGLHPGADHRCHLPA